MDRDDVDERNGVRRAVWDALLSEVPAIGGDVAVVVDGDSAEELIGLYVAACERSRTAVAACASMDT